MKKIFFVCLTIMALSSCSFGNKLLQKCSVQTTTDGSHTILCAQCDSIDLQQLINAAKKNVK